MLAIDFLSVLLGHKVQWKAYADILPGNPKETRPLRRVEIT
jgi:hypothetical protein